MCALARAGGRERCRSASQFTLSDGPRDGMWGLENVTILSCILIASSLYLLLVYEAITLLVFIPFFLQSLYLYWSELVPNSPIS